MLRSKFMKEQYGIDTDFDFIKSCLASHDVVIKDKRILITGGTGFLGSWLVAYLLWANDVHGDNNHISIVTRDKSRFLSNMPECRNNQLVTIIEHDLAVPLESDTSFDLIIHGATDVQKAVSDDDSFNCAAIGTQSIISIAKLNPNCRVVYLSSGAVYGANAPDVWCKETDGPRDHALASLNAYTAQKISSEETLLVASAGGQFRCSVARCFTFVGAFIPRTKQFAISEFMQNALADEDIILSGNELTQRSYLYCADFVVWLLVIFMRSENGAVINLGSNSAIAIGDLASKVVEVLGSKSRIVKATMSQNATATSYLPNTDKAGSQLGLRQYTTFEDAIIKTRPWFDISDENK